MEIGLIFKVVFFLLWPFLILLIFYLINKKKFLAKWEKFKQAGFFEKNN
jgi:hypothetical protein